MFSDLHVLILNGGRDTFYYFFTKPSKTLGKTRSPIHVYLRFPRACTGKNPFRAHESSAGSGGTSETEVIGERKDLYILLNPPARRRAQLAHPPYRCRGNVDFQRREVLPLDTLCVKT